MRVQFIQHAVLSLLNKRAFLGPSREVVLQNGAIRVFL
jgi:hypothetical protein